LKSTRFDFEISEDSNEGYL